MNPELERFPPEPWPQTVVVEISKFSVSLMMELPFRGALQDILAIESVEPVKRSPRARIPSCNDVEITRPKLAPTMGVRAKKAMVNVMASRVLNGVWNTNHCTSDSLKPLEDLALFPGGNSIPVPERFRLEIVDRRLWMVYSKIVTGHKDQPARTCMPPARNRCPHSRRGRPCTQPPLKGLAK
jgi:hypothetical protein